MSEAGVRGVTANLQHLQLMLILSIDPELSDRSNKGFKWCYKKYKAFNAAVQTMDEMFKNGKWPLPKKPNHTELVEIFLSKSFWHSHVVKSFSMVASHPQMVEWLENQDGDGPSDFDVWHLQKSDYGFKELKEWLKNDGTLDRAAKGRLEKSRERGNKGKGKGKEKEKEKEKEKKKRIGKGKGKEKEKEIESDDSEKASGSSKSHRRK